MELQINRAVPSVMHIDLNSCFAIAEQQANPFLRGRPIAVAAYTGPSGCVLSPSYQAKKLGVKVGMRVRDAKDLCPDITILAPDPPKYRAVHQMFCRLFREFAPSVTPKSIDEAVLDFTGLNYSESDLIRIGEEIKLRMRKEIGEYITCNVGISTNRFLAKTAASLHKPDGLDVINYKNLKDVLSKLELIDLCGINVRFKWRLNAGGVYTPLEFLNAHWTHLKKNVFHSIVGVYWYSRLRGWEVDNVEFGRKSYGQSYALHKFTSDMDELSKFLMKLCEKMGRRVRRAGYYAGGIHVGCAYSDSSYWHMGRKKELRLYSTQEFYEEALKILIKQPEEKPLTHIFVSCFNLKKTEVMQLSMFDEYQQKRWRIAQKMDFVNDWFGEYVVTPANMMGMNDVIIDRIPFGGTKDLIDLYQN